MEFDTTILNNVITDRAELIIKKILKETTGTYVENITFYMGGNILNNIHRKTDIDLFPVDHANFGRLVTILCDFSVCTTRNSNTYVVNGQPIQLCKYYHESLKSLVDSFDYSHIQVGVRVDDWEVAEVYYTQAYLNSRVIGNSEYLGSKYPLSSVIRAFKYREYNELSKSRMIYSIIAGVSDMIERGVSDYEDFKDQLNAVDLALLPEDLQDFKGQNHKLIKLFNNLVTDEELKIELDEPVEQSAEEAINTLEGGEDELSW